MKVLIWIGCIFVASILNAILGEITGFKIGYLLFYLGVSFLARKLCQKWDEHKEAKAQKKRIAEAVEALRGKDRGFSSSATSGWQCVCGRFHPLYETSCVCGNTERMTAAHILLRSIVARASSISVSTSCGSWLAIIPRACTTSNGKAMDGGSPLD